jgi:hypothetical protein
MSQSHHLQGKDKSSLERQHETAQRIKQATTLRWLVASVTTAPFVSNVKQLMRAKRDIYNFHREKQSKGWA